MVENHGCADDNPQVLTRNIEVSEEMELEGRSHQRVALVIGNSKYQHYEPLRASVADAEDIASVLGSEQFGFDVVPRTEATLADMKAAVNEVAQKLGPSSLLVIFYAGHGLQLGQKNYLVPVEHNAATDPFLFDALSLNDVLDRLNLTNSSLTSIVIMDACRTQAQRSGTAYVSARYADEQIASKMASSFLAFACAPGENATESVDQRNGFFTAAILQHISEGLQLEVLFGRVGQSLLEMTNQQQQCMTHSAMNQEPLYLMKTEMSDLDDNARRLLEEQNALRKKEVREAKEAADTERTARKDAEEQLKLEQLERRRQAEEAERERHKKEMELLRKENELLAAEEEKLRLENERRAAEVKRAKLENEKRAAEAEKQRLEEEKKRSDEEAARAKKERDEINDKLHRSFEKKIGRELHREAGDVKKFFKKVF